jgi:N-methylhydantoinase A
MQVLGMRRVIVPQFPGALSALGLLLADVRKDYSRTLLIDAKEADAKLKSAFAELHRLGLADLQAEGFKKNEIHRLDFVDLRYRGQSYELMVALAADFIERFHETHERRYGYANRGRDVELVNVRTQLLGRTLKPRFSKTLKQRSRPVPVDTQPVWIGHRRVKAAIYDRASLVHGHVIKGPAIIGEYSSTTLVPPGFRCVVDAYLNLVLEL